MYAYKCQREISGPPASGGSDERWVTSNYLVGKYSAGGVRMHDNYLHLHSGEGKGKRMVCTKYGMKKGQDILETIPRKAMAGIRRQRAEPRSKWHTDWTNYRSTRRFEKMRTDFSNAKRERLYSSERRNLASWR